MEMKPTGICICSRRAAARHHAGVHQAAEQRFCELRAGRPATKCPRCSAPVDFVNVDGITVVGERIVNPTGKKRFQRALQEEDMNYVLEQAVSQVVLRCWT